MILFEKIEIAFTHIYVYRHSQICKISYTILQVFRIDYLEEVSFETSNPLTLNMHHCFITIVTAGKNRLSV